MIRRALEGFWRDAASHAALVLLAACALALAGGALLGAKNAARLLASWGEAGQLVVYLRGDAAESDTRGVEALLAGVPAVERVERVTASRARERLVEALGTQSPLLEGIEASFFPASIEVSLRAGAGEIGPVSALARRLEKAPGVERVDFGAEWIDRLRGARRFVSAGASAIAIAAAGLALAVVFFAMRLASIARRREIDVLRLCGATDGFVRAPLLLEGALAGLLAGGLALGAVALAFSRVAPAVADALGFALAGAPAFFAGGEILAGLCAAAVLGAVATAVAVEPHLG